MIKLYLPWPFKDEHFGEYKWIKYGLENNSEVELVDELKESDYTVYVNDIKNVSRYERNERIKEKIYDEILTVCQPEKEIIVDYNDWNMIHISTPEHIPITKYFLYFKRSVCSADRTRPLGARKFCTYDGNVIPISYAMRSDYLQLTKDVRVDSPREIDIRTFFNGNEGKDRGLIPHMVLFFSQRLYPCKTVIGRAEDDENKGKSAYNVVNNAYIRDMLKSKIIVTCNPPNWEGDYRLFEALCSGALVFVDEMITPVKNSFENKVHLVYYNQDNLLELLHHYLTHEEERLSIAKQGLEYARKYHTWRNRADEIVEEIVKRK